MKKCTLTILLSIVCYAMSATNYYISQSTGSDFGNNGLSQTAPFKNIQRGADLVNAGDTVFVMNGTYTNICAACDVVNINRAGTSAAWIVFMPLVGHTPIISFTGWQGIKFEPNAAYIEVKNFIVSGNNANIKLADALIQPAGCTNPMGSSNPIYNGNGIAADGRKGTTKRPHHLRVVNNTIFDCGGGGVSMIQSDYVTIENNLIYNNSWYTIYGASGISCWQNWNFDTQAGYHFVIRNNRCYGNQLFVKWIGSCTISDGNGIIIDDSRNTQNGSNLGIYTGKTLIANNICYQNGGSGIHTYESDNVDVVNNTAYHNSVSVEIKGEIFANSSKNIRFFNNIIVPLDNEPANDNYMNSNITSDYNCYLTNKPITILGAHDLQTDPKFMNAATFDFQIQATSHCRDAGTATAAPTTDFKGESRPKGVGFDIGAYEFAPIVATLNLDNEKPLKIYPNPANTILTIENAEGKNVEIIDISGKTMLAFFAINHQFPIMINQLKSGIYFVKTGNKIVRFIKE
jgi:parallel beta-helix repeat protein